MSMEERATISHEATALPPLSLQGCRIPAVAHAQAHLLRATIYQSLQSVLAPHDTASLSALALACHLHPEAKWWLQHRGQALRLIAEASQKLLRLRQMATEPGMAHERSVS